MKEQITIVSSPHERPKNQSIKSVPQTEEEFYQIVNNAGGQELKEYGFRKWETMNNLIKENIAHKDDSKMVNIPVFNASTPEQAADLITGIINDDIVKSDGSMLMDLAPKEPVPMELLEQDEDVILFPGEWYNIIPNGFKCTSLYGEESVFIKGKSDDDIRFGCLPYGIRRKVA